MRSIACRWYILLCCLSLCSSFAYSHNLNFGTLTVNQLDTDEHQFNLVFQLSSDQGSHQQSSVIAPDECELQSATVEQNDKIRIRTRQSLRCLTPGFENKQFKFEKLPPDSIILARALQGGQLIDEQLLRGEAGTWQIKASGKRQEGVFLNYTYLGVEHILIGWDHLLFLAMLMLMVPRGWKLVQVITAFTVGHSITLSLATLEWVDIPIAPTEALIALSIMFLAAEVIRYERFAYVTLTQSYPGIITLLFGLFHGLGFASVLSDIGIPEDQVLWSLIGFNMGVEFGQLLFVAVILTAAWALLGISRVRYPSKSLFAYVGGSLGAFWLFERVFGF